MKNIFMVEDKLFDTYFLDSTKMCDLLCSQTGLKWKPAHIVGEYMEDDGDYDHDAGVTFFKYYGLALINEKHPYFNLDYLNRDDLRNEQCKSNMILAVIGSTKDIKLFPGDVISTKYHTARKYEEKVFQKFNWMHYYLYAKDLFPKQITKQYNGDSVNWSRDEGEFSYYLDDVFGSFCSQVLESVNLHKDIIVNSVDNYFANLKVEEKKSKEILKSSSSREKI